MIPHNRAEIGAARAAPLEGEFLTKGIGEMATVDKMPMLAEGYEKLQNDVRHLKRSSGRRSSRRSRKRARHGDLSENAEYHAAKERQGQVEATIADLEDRISRARSSTRPTLSGDKVVFGATVPVARRGRQADQISDRRPDRGGRQGRPHSYDSPSAAR